MNLLVKATLDIEPPAVRVISFSPEITLDRVHVVLQAAFGWQNSHLHQFTHRNSRVIDRKFFVYPSYEDEGFGDFSDFGNFTPSYTEKEELVKLSEVLVNPGDFIEYEYDFGDSWTHRLELIGESEHTHPDVPAVVLSAEGAGRKEDSGFIVNEKESFLPLPDIEAINTNIARSHNLEIDADSAFYFGQNAGNDLVTLANKHRPRFGPDEVIRLIDTHAGSTPPELTHAIDIELRKVMAPWLRFLELLETNTKLTQAGFLPPAWCKEFVEEHDITFVSKSTKEENIIPILVMHEVTRATKLTRRYKGHVKTTKLGHQLRNSPTKLIPYIIRGIYADMESRYDIDATILGLLLGLYSEDKNLQLNAALDRRNRYKGERGHPEKVFELLETHGWRVDVPENWNFTPAPISCLLPLERIIDIKMDHHPAPISEATLRYVAWHALQA